MPPEQISEEVAEEGGVNIQTMYIDNAQLSIICRYIDCYKSSFWFCDSI